MLARQLRCLKPLHRYFSFGFRSSLSSPIQKTPTRVLAVPPTPLARPSNVEVEVGEDQSSRRTELQLWWTTREARTEAHLQTHRPTVLPRDLVLLLIRLMDSYPRLAFHQVAQAHEAHSRLQSNDSFNALLDLACRSPYPDSFLSVYQLMAKRGFGDQTTRRLYVRHLVRHGTMEEALALVEADAEGWIRRDLLWEVIQVPVKDPRRYLASEGKAHKLPPARAPSPIVLAALTSALKVNLDGASSLFVESSIAYLLYINRFEDAFAVARHFIQLLTASPSPDALLTALTLIHKLLELPPATISKKPHSHVPQAPTALDLIDLHPLLRPTSTTLTYTLEWYRWKLHRSRRAYALLREWKANWGDHVEDSRVRHKIASYALVDKNVILARKMINREYRARQSRLAGERDRKAERAPREWEGPRNDDLWNDVLEKYASFDPKRKWTAEEGVWSSGRPTEDNDM